MTERIDIIIFDDISQICVTRITEDMGWYKKKLCICDSCKSNNYQDYKLNDSVDSIMAHLLHHLFDGDRFSAILTYRVKEYFYELNRRNMVDVDKVGCRL